METNYKWKNSLIKPTLNVYMANYAMAQNTVIEKLSEEDIKIAKSKYKKFYESERD
jgi:hypothetical protein